MAGKRMGFIRLLRLYGLYARMDLSWFLRDTGACLLAMAADLISSVAAVSGVFLLAWRFDGVGGMSKYEVLFMMGYVTVVTGVMLTFFSSCNTGHISRRIGRGQVEHMLIQPVPLPVQLLTEGFIPVSGSGNLLSGGVIIAVALRAMGIVPSLWWALSLTGSVALSVVILLALSYLFSSAAFYAPVQAEEISSYVMDAAETLSAYPLSGMPLSVQIPLVTLFPAGLLGWFPSLALLGRPPLDLPCYYPVMAAGLLFILTYVIFRKGLRYYVKTGTNRYSAMGHRR